MDPQQSPCDAEAATACVLELSPAPLMVVHGARITALNAAAAELLGAQEPADLIGASGPAVGVPDLAPGERVEAQVPSGAVLRFTASARHGPAGELVLAVEDRTQMFDAVRARQAADDRFELLLARGTDVLAIVDDTGVIIWISPSMYGLTGFKPEQVIGTDGFTLVHPDDVPRVADELAERAAVPGAHPPMRYRLHHADGSCRWVEAASINMLDDPRVAGMVMFLRDVTTPVLQAQLFDRHTDLLARSAAGTPDVAHHLQEYAAAAQELLEVRHPGTTVRFREAYLDDDDDDALEVSLPPGHSASGEELRVLARTERLMMLTRAQDTMLRQLRSSEEQFRFGFQNTATAAAFVAPDGTLLRVNAAMCQLTGTDAGVLVGSSWGALRHPDEHAPALDLGAPVSGSSRLVTRWLTPTGLDLWVEVHVGAIVDGAGNRTGSVMHFVDITERLRTEERLHELNLSLRGEADLATEDRNRFAALFRRVAMQREVERTSLAHVISEEAVQRVVASQWALDDIQGEDGSAARTAASAVHANLTDVVAALHHVAVGARPATLDLVGLEQALRQAATEIAAGSEATSAESGPVPVTVAVDQPYPKDTETLIFRFLTAALALPAPPDQLSALDLSVRQVTDRPASPDRAAQSPDAAGQHDVLPADPDTADSVQAHDWVLARCTIFAAGDHLVEVAQESTDLTVTAELVRIAGGNCRYRVLPDAGGVEFTLLAPVDAGARLLA